MPDSICRLQYNIYRNTAMHKRKTAFAMRHIIVAGCRLVLRFALYSVVVVVNA